MIYLFRALFSKDLDPWGLGLIRVGEMRLLQQQRKPSVLQTFHSMALRHLFNLLHSRRASLCPATRFSHGKSFRCCMDKVWEVQVWRLCSQPKPYSSTGGQIQTLIAAASQLCSNFCFAAMH